MKRCLVIISTILVICLSFALIGCTRESHENMMGTSIALKIKGGNASKAEKDIYAMIKDVEGSVSTNIATSTIGIINSAKAGEIIELDEHTNIMVSRAYELYKLSGGAFDISIYPLVRLWKFSPDTISQVSKKPPTKEEIDKVLSNIIGFDKCFRYDEEKCTITKLVDGAMLDLGAVAKGYVADRAKDILTKYNVKEAIVNIGGTLYLYGDRSFVVGIQNPRKSETTDDIADKIDVSNMAVSTSGDYERYYLDEVTGERYHHILDPFLGKPSVHEYNSVTIKCVSAMDADILSTAVYVMGKKEGVKMLKELDKSIEAVFIASDGNTINKEHYIDGELV